MKVALVLVLLLTMISINETSLLNYFGTYVSEILRADILESINCILHSEIIIYDVNVIIDGILTKDFNKMVAAIAKVIQSLIDEVKKCLNDPAFRLHINNN